MWDLIDKETYMQKVKGLKPLESYTDPDGTQPMSCGRPQIVTIWGTCGNKDENDIPVVKCVMRKNDRHVLTWETEYFEYVNPAVQDSVTHTMQQLDPNQQQQEAATAEVVNEQATTDQVAAVEQEAQEQAMESAEEGTTEG